MSSEALYEQYKDALKRGHVASLRGRLEDALLAYAEAARIAPERSTPHSSAGTALLRRKRPADAIRHYEVALAMAPHDEAAMLGRAQALAAMERRADAADAYDALAEVRAGSGKLADAVDAARRGLEMAEGRERRGTLERLIRRLRASEPDEPGRLALERALRVLDGEAVPTPPAHGAVHAGRRTPAEVAHQAAVSTEPDQPVAATLAAAATASETSPETEPPDASFDAAAVTPGVVQAGRELAAVAAEPPADGAETGPESGSEASSATETDPFAPTEPAAIPVPLGRRPLDRDLPPDSTTAELEARAQAATDAGVPGPALEALLDLAAAFRRDGHIDAALDACYGALTFDPDGIALHLALVELYDECGWTVAALDKLALTEALVRLDGDAGSLAMVASARAGRD